MEKSLIADALLSSQPVSLGYFYIFIVQMWPTKCFINLVAKPFFLFWGGGGSVVKYPPWWPHLAMAWRNLRKLP